MGCTSPFSSNTCVMPIFLPKIPVTAMESPYLLLLSVSHHRVQAPSSHEWREARLPAWQILLFEDLDLDIDTSRKIEFHQGIHRLLGRLENVDQPLMRADFEGLARFLIHVRRTQHAILVLHGRQRNRPRDLCARA